MKIGDKVRVTSGPAFVPHGRATTGTVVEITPTPSYPGDDDAEVMVLVKTGGLWGFRRGHLTVCA